MKLARLVQLVGLVLVTCVMVQSYIEPPSMLFQFGGLGLGALVFVSGWLMGGGGDGASGGGQG